MKKHIITCCVILLLLSSSFFGVSKQIEIKEKSIIYNNTLIRVTYGFPNRYTSLYDWSSYHNFEYTEKINRNPIVETIYFTNPLNNDIFRAGDSINITGTITDEKFKNYIVEYGQGTNPTEWLTTGITLINGGNLPIEDGTVAIWDTSHITKPDFFTLRITTNLKNKPKIFSLEKSKVILFPLIQQLINNILQKNMQVLLINNHKTNFIKNVYLDPTLKEGWPQRIKWDKIPWDDDPLDGYIWAGLTEPVVSDINNDGNMEIVVYTGGDPTKIYVFNSDGCLVDGWPVSVDNELLPGGNIGSPTIVDIDHDGYKEIFVNGNEGIYIFNYNGSFLRKFKQKDSSRPWNAGECVVYDLNNDGSMEIIKKYVNNTGNVGVDLTVFDIYGNVLSGWPQRIYPHTGPTNLGGEGIPAIGNFDDDSDYEIVVATNKNLPGEGNYDGRIIIFNLDGSILDGFPLDIDSEFYWQSPAIGDLNNDGMDEIITSAQKGLYVIDRYGNNCTGWPQLEDTKITPSPAIGDLNNDGYLEIVISKRGEPCNTYVFDHTGNIISGWPQETSWNDYRAPIIGDINSDGKPDVLTTAGNGVAHWCLENGGVYAWNQDGNLIDGFPKVTECDAQAGATIADIDNDGKVEIIASSNYDEDFETNEGKKRSSIYVWELDSEFNGETMKWPMFHHDPQHTGYYALDFPCFTSIGILR